MIRAIVPRRLSLLDAALAVLVLVLLIGVVGCGEPTKKFTNVYADTCAHGMSNEPAPGTCGKFIDENTDGLCDRSQPKEISEPA
jgi:hypothetical protein